MNKLAKYLIIGAAGILALCGCGNTADVAPTNEHPEDQQLEGADWRTWGIIDATGTLELGGEKIDVCACLYADRAELYYNEEKQRLYTTIEFPEKLSDEEYEKLSIHFADDTGDDNTDVQFEVGTENTLDRRFSYIYDEATGDFVYDAFSVFPNPNVIDDDTDESLEGHADFTGRFTEPVTGRCLIEITPESDDSYTIVVTWADSASDEYIWAITGATYGEYGDELVYSDCLYYHRTWEDSETYTDEDLYDDGTGRFWMTDGGMLGWESNCVEVDGIDGETLFERLEQ